MLNIGERIFYRNEVYEVLELNIDTDGFDDYHYTLIKNTKTNEIKRRDDSLYDDFVSLKNLKFGIEQKEKEIIKKQEELDNLYKDMNYYIKLLK